MEQAVGWTKGTDRGKMERKMREIMALKAEARKGPMENLERQWRAEVSSNMVGTSPES
jgi:hypothetical protein